MKQIYKFNQLEILVSTKNQYTFDFLMNMFQHNDLLQYKIIVIHQTETGHTLSSPYPNVIVYNESELGLSKSRNMAIQKSSAQICLLADDDVVFRPGFEKDIIQAFNYFDQPKIVTFKTLTTNGEDYWNYPKQPGLLKNKKIRKVLSIEIAFQRNWLEENNFYFNELFGLGAPFEDSENDVFLNEIIKAGHSIHFYPAYIAEHPPVSSSDQIDSPRLIYARGALFYYKYGWLAYIYVLKLSFFLVRKNYIKLNQLPNVLLLGFKGIRNYKSTIHEKTNYY